MKQIQNELGVQILADFEESFQSKVSYCWILLLINVDGIHPHKPSAAQFMAHLQYGHQGHTVLLELPTVL